MPFHIDSLLLDVHFYARTETGCLFIRFALICLFYSGMARVEIDFHHSCWCYGRLHTPGRRASIQKHHAHATPSFRLIRSWDRACMADSIFCLLLDEMNAMKSLPSIVHERRNKCVPKNESWQTTQNVSEKCSIRCGMISEGKDWGRKYIINK